MWRNSKGCPNIFHGRVDNIRVNQDCTLRRQAEEWVGVNPRDFKNVLAGQNDSRVGFNHCGYDWSLDRGRRWGDTGTSPPPFYQELFVQTNDTADACSDPAGTFDHLGNAYVTGVFFDVADVESSIWVAKSNAPLKGRLYHEPRQTPFQEYSTAVMGEPANDNNPDIFHDKELMQADSRDASPKKGRVYLTWTRFETTATPVGARSPIVFSQSTDGGATWSPQVIISGSNAALCADFSGTPGNPNACDQDQGSHPSVGPDGTIYVIFGNGNTPEAGINQVLIGQVPTEPGLQRRVRLGRAVPNQQPGRDAPVRSCCRRLPGTAMPAAQRLPCAGVHLHVDLGRPQQQSVRDLGRPPQQHQPQL